MSLTQATKPALQSSFQGNVNPGTATGSVSYNANGLYGQSLIITNPSTFGAYAVNYVSYTLDYIIPLTTSIWIKFPTVSASYVQYFLNFSGGPGGISYALYLETNNSFTLRAQSATGGFGSPAYVTTTPASVVSGKWYHVVTVIDGSYMSIYINGTLAGINNTFIGSGLNNPYLGGVKDGNPNRFIINAELADFRVYKTALSAIQVQALYNNGGTPGVPASTTMVASAPVVRDTSPNPLTLSTYGSATSNTNSPFGGSELSIENLTYYIPSTVSKTNFSFWGSNCFIEFWMYLSGTNSGNPRIISRGSYPNEEYSVYMNASSGGYYLKFAYGTNFPFSFQFVPGTWNHYSFSYNYATQMLYGSINGTVYSGGTTAGQSYNSGSTVDLYPSGSGYVIDISNLRVVTGATTLPYISNFTVPTAPLSNYPTGTTALLLRVVVGPIRLTGTPLLSQLSVAPVGAFSLRAVNGVTAKAVRVRRASDNATQDFYADRLGNLLTAPVTGTDLATWLGGATGYVATWYDQSGQGNHMSCSSFGIQPKIDLVNNFIDLKPSAYFDVSAGTTGPVPFQSSKNYTVVFRHGQFIGAGLFATSQNAAGPYGNLVNNFKKGTGLTYTQYWYGNDVQNKGTLATGNRVSYKWDGTNRSLYVNGVLVDVSPSSGWAQTSSAIQMIGKTNLDGAMNGELYGAFMFTTALSDTDRTLLENFL